MIRPISVGSTVKIRLTLPASDCSSIKTALGLVAKLVIMKLSRSFIFYFLRFYFRFVRLDLILQLGFLALLGTGLVRFVHVNACALTTDLACLRQSRICVRLYFAFL